VTAAIRAAFRAADVEQGHNFDTEITPLERRVYPWTMIYKSADYQRAAPRSANDSTDREPARGFYVDISQAALDSGIPNNGSAPSGLVAKPGVVHLSAWLAGGDPWGGTADDDLVIDGCVVDLDDLERFAAALTAMVTLARQRDGATRRGGRAS
jgi:hypothetical protein